MPVLYAACQTSYLRYDDSNDSWFNLGPPPTTQSTKLQYFGDGLMYHLTGNPGNMRRSDDGGTTWADIPAPAGVTWIDYARDAVGRIWALGAAGQVYRSADGLGDDWELLTTIGASNPRAIACSFADYNVAVVNQQTSLGGPNLIYTLDNGVSWTTQGWGGGGNSPSNGGNLLRFTASDSNLLVATGYAAARYGQFDGFTALVDARRGGNAATSFKGNIAQAGLDGAVFMAVEGHGGDPDEIWRSTDRGGTWQVFTIPIPLSSVGGLMAGPDEDAGYIVSQSAVWQFVGASNGDLSDPTLWTQLASPGCTLPSVGGAMALVEEGIFTSQPPGGIDGPTYPPGDNGPPADNGGMTLPPPQSLIYDWCEYAAKFRELAPEAYAKALQDYQDALAAWKAAGGDSCQGPDCQGFPQPSDNPGIEPVWKDGKPMHRPVSLKDRVPPGEYVLVRNASQGYAARIAQAKALGMRGVVFLLGDTEDPALDTYPGGPLIPPQHLTGALRWQPDALGRPWQVHQFELASDGLQPGADGKVRPMDCEIFGPQSARDQKLVVGGLFVCGQDAFERPAQAAAMIATTRNRLGLDFVMIDIDTKLRDGSYVWAQPRARDKVLVLASHVQQRFVKSPRNPSQIELSAHCPVFFVFPQSPFGPGGTQLFAELLDNPASPLGAPGVSDATNLFPGFDNNYTGPVTFAAPRIVDGQLQDGWQWAKPRKSVNFFLGLTHCAFVLTASSAGLASSALADGGVSVTFNNQSRGWTVQSGMVVYDDIDIAPVAGGGGDWWDMDLVDVHGSYVPALAPDPPPIAIVGENYRAWTDPWGYTITSDEAASINAQVVPGTSGSGLEGPTPGDPGALPTGPSSGALSIQQAYDAAIQAGFTPDQAVIAVSIMMAESSLDSGATGYNKNSDGSVSSTDRGIAQINDVYHPEVSDACAYDANCAISAMYRISSGGTDFSPWSTYNAGSNQRYLGDVQNAVGQTAPGSETSGPNDPNLSYSDPDGPPPSSGPGAAFQRGLTLWWENWKVGHLAGELGKQPKALLPNLMKARGQEADCNDETIVRTAIPSWIRINGKWPIPLAGGDYMGYISATGNRVTFTGKPCEGDEGLYAIDIGVSHQLGAGVSNTVPIVIEVANKKLMEDGETWSTGLKSPVKDIGPRLPSEDYKEASGLHGHVPKVHHPRFEISAYHDSFGPDFCPGADYPLPPRDIDRTFRECPPKETACGGKFIGDLAVAADEWCMNDGIMPGKPLVCGIGGNKPQFIAFVEVMALALSGYDPNYGTEGGCVHGLFAINNCAGGPGEGYTRDQLVNEELNAAIALPLLAQAFADTAPSLIGGKACKLSGHPAFTTEEKLQHAALAYAALSIPGTGLHGGPGAVGASNGTFHDENPCATDGPYSAIVKAEWQCYMDLYNGGGGTAPGKEGGSGQPTPAGDGSGIPDPPDGTYIPGCPVKGRPTMTADCDWHYANEGIPAIDLAAPTRTDLAAVCDGKVIYRGLDKTANPRGSPVPHHTRGLGIETWLQCDNGYVIRYGHQELEQFGPTTIFGFGCCESYYGFDDGHEQLVESATIPCPYGDEPVAGECPCSCFEFGEKCLQDTTQCCGDPICDNGNNAHLGRTPGENGCVPCEGFEVKAGDFLGEMDSTGYSSGSHVHIEVWSGGPPGSGHRICPMEVLSAVCW